MRELTMEGTDEELLSLVRQGSAEAYSELWRRYVRAARTAAGRYRRLADPDDLVAEAYTVILRALRGGHGPTEQFKPYLYATVRNLALRELRRVQHLADDTIDELADQLPDESQPKDDEAADRRLALTALEQLPERWRRVLWHSEVEGRSTAEIGHLMDLKPAAVAVLAFRARAALREAWLSAHLSARGVVPGCRTVWTRLAPYSMGTLPARTRDRVEAHLRGCGECARGERELRKYASRVSVVLVGIGIGGVVAANIASSAGAAAHNPIAALRTRPLQVAVVGGLVVAASGVLLVQSLGAIPGTVAASVSAPVASIEVVPPVADKTPLDNQGDQVSTSPDAVPDLAPPVQPRGLSSPTDAPPPVQPLSEPHIDDVSALIAASSLVLSGMGVPGASVVVGDGSTPVIATVDVDGRWEVTVTDLVDGDHVLRIWQQRPGFQDSDTAVVHVRVDTLPPPSPIVSSTWSSTQFTPPDLEGTAEPGARVVVNLPGDAELASTTADDTGAWSIPQLPGLSALISELRIVQVDAAGNVSAASVVGPFDFVPVLLTPTDGSAVSAGSVMVTMAGWPGQQVILYVDGAGVGIFTIPAGGTYAVQLTSPDGGPVSLGTYQMSLRYWSATEGESPHAAEITFLAE